MPNYLMHPSNCYVLQHATMLKTHMHGINYTTQWFIDRCNCICCRQRRDDHLWRYRQRIWAINDTTLRICSSISPTTRLANYSQQNLRNCHGANFDKQLINDNCHCRMTSNYQSAMVVTNDDDHDTHCKCHICTANKK